MTTANAISLILLISALVAATGFVGTYASFAPWRANEVGRSMMLLAIALILMVCSAILLTALGPAYPGRTAVRIGTYVVLNVALWRQLMTLMKVLNAKTRSVKSTLNDDTPPVPSPRKEAEDKQSVI